MAGPKYVRWTRREDIPKGLLDRLRARYERDGLSSYQIAEEEGLSSTTTYRLLVLAGTNFRPQSGPGHKRKVGAPGPSSQELADVRERYKAGASTYKIGEAIGRSDQTVRRWLRRQGVSLRAEGGGERRPPPEYLASLRQRYESGETVREIAADIGRPKRTVNYWLKLAGTPMRKGGPRPKTSAGGQRPDPRSPTCEPARPPAGPATTSRGEVTG